MVEQNRLEKAMKDLEPFIGKNISVAYFEQNSTRHKEGKYLGFKGEHICVGESSSFCIEVLFSGEKLFVTDIWAGQKHIYDRFAYIPPAQ